MAAKLPSETVQKIVELRRKGKTTREIAARFNICASTVSRVVRRYKARGGPIGESPPPNPVGHLMNRVDVDGSVELVSMDRPYTIKELAKMAGLDPKKYVPKYPKPSTWQGFYKLKGFITQKVVEKLVAMAKKGASVEEIFHSVNHGALQGHQKVQLFGNKCTFERVMDEAVEHAIIDFAQKYVKPIPKKDLPKTLKRGRVKKGAAQMVSWGMWDAHLGMYAWRGEVGSDYDVDIAANRICNSVDDMIEALRIYPIAKILMPVGNDFLHFDNVRQKTAHGAHELDVDSRFGRVYNAGVRCLCYMVERAVEICDDVELIYVPGNHDLGVSYTLAALLAHRYMNDKRITADLSFNPRKFKMWGQVLLGFEHGRDASPNQIAMTFPQNALRYWSKSKYREVQIGDKHQGWEKMYESVIPTNGVTVRRHPALCNVDSYHWNRDLIGEPVKSVQAWRYDSQGVVGSHVAWARDVGHVDKMKVRMP